MLWHRDKRKIQGHLKELYHTEVSPALNSADEVADEVRQWQGRPLTHLYEPGMHE